MNKPVGLFLIPFSFLVLASCSVQQKISRPAKKLLLNDSSLLTAHVGISIYEPAAGKYWFNYQGDKYFVPASNTKIPTCYAAMKYLGDSLVGFRYITHLIQNEISILPSGDPSFLHADYNSGKAIEFLKKFRAVSLLANNFFYAKWGSGWSWNDYMESYMAERSSFPLYANTVTFFLKDNRVLVSPSFFNKKISGYFGQPLDGFQITRSLDTNDFRMTKGNLQKQIVPFSTGKTWIPSAQAELLSDTLKIPVSPGMLSAIEKNEFRIFYSQPTDSLLKPMMHRSDNFFAEQTLLMVSNEMLGVMSDEKIIDTLLKTDFKDLPQKPRWVDGSGLSRYNLFTPQSLIAILNKMKNEFPMERIKEILPTGGEGTLSSYYKADSGYIYAKTGTLSGVVTLSGYLYTKKNKLLIFSILVNNHQASATAVRKAVEKFIQKVRNKY
jgi:D-alanyl-D-alanine carboxypeptidase/D-alanyl-D-alanine-endopeptidase (penicillin-binding protein 4)